MHRLTLLLLIPLIACAEPAERCERAVEREIRVVSRLIDETERNLRRGYAYELEPRHIRTGLTLCSGGRNVSFCTGGYNTPRRTPVAIDPEAEQRKLDKLQARRSALVSRGVGTCVDR
ncbi:hypothetical protein [Roseitranquillus sediminis]|uniref:hypothetical protein n=1 Tax=Roseitranquillus sediminis TaxID=2809051 RepID=UPI001D0CAD5C|nr:hypothetical protein [Roseitranquillus sediminis]MBM9593251.1 hypothetical protein [Roseitranquillus sediminis]